MSEAIYRGYDQGALDWQYNARARVREVAGYVDFYANQSERARRELPNTLDLGYGPSAAETLDVFHPVETALPIPVQVFLHGGYWRAFHKDDFSFTARSIVAAGGIAVVVNYALMPGVTMDELVRQCRAALAWTYRNIAEHGGDPDRIFISGHSAGGHLVAMMLATDWAETFELPADLIKGAVAISGLYDLEPIRLSYLNQDLGLNSDDAAANSPINCLPTTAAIGRGSIVLTYGALESDEFARQTELYATGLRATGLDCEIQTIAGHHHMSVVAMLERADSQLSRIITRQMGLA
jgi:arylformamidase